MKKFTEQELQTLIGLFAQGKLNEICRRGWRLVKCKKNLDNGTSPFAEEELEEAKKQYRRALIHLFRWHKVEILPYQRLHYDDLLIESADVFARLAVLRPAC